MRVFVSTELIGRRFARCCCSVISNGEGVNAADHWYGAEWTQLNSSLATGRSADSSSGLCILSDHFRPAGKFHLITVVFLVLAVQSFLPSV